LILSLPTPRATDKCGNSPTLSGILPQWWIRRLVIFSPNPALAGNASHWEAAPTVQLISEQDPLKQGLKLYDLHTENGLVQVFVGKIH